MIDDPGVGVCNVDSLGPNTYYFFGIQVEGGLLHKKLPLICLLWPRSKHIPYPWSQLRQHALLGLEFFASGY